MTRSEQQMITANGVELCAQTFGDASDPSILLIAGGGASMLWWEDEFCERLAAGDRYVIRYDNRDTGKSVSYEPGNAPYTGRELVDDAVGVLDAFDIERAHVVGISMGGGIGQHIALVHPQRVASLTLIETSPAAKHSSNLPDMAKDLLDYYTNTQPPDWSNEAAVIESFVDETRALASKSRPFDEAAIRDLISQDVERTKNIAAALSNHPPEEGEPPSGSLSDITAPTLVLHGDEDPLFPLGHGQALANEIPDARLVVLRRNGHELPSAAWDVAIPAILEHSG